MSRIPPSMRDPDFLSARMAPAVKRLIPGKLHTPIASPLPRGTPDRRTHPNLGGTQNTDYWSKTAGALINAGTATNLTFTGSPIESSGSSISLSGGEIQVVSGTYIVTASWYCPLSSGSTFTATLSTYDDTSASWGVLGFVSETVPRCVVTSAWTVTGPDKIHLQCSVSGFSGTTVSASVKALVQRIA